MLLDVVLRELSARADSSGMFLDFDGTLSEIAPSPDAATAVPGSAEALERLARRFRLVAIVTGRRVAEVQDRLGRPDGVRFFGLYGLEGGSDTPRAGVAERSGEVERILPHVSELAAGIPGTLVEPKGSNLAVHYRLSPDPEAAREALAAALEPLARASGMTLIEGKRVLEMVPSGAPTKGNLVAREGIGLEAVLYAGDDLADLEAFRAVDALAEGGVFGVKVAVRSAETPAELLEDADLTVEGPGGLLSMLRALADPA